MSKFSDKHPKLATFLKEKAPGILDAIGDTFPPFKILSSLIEKSGLKPEELDEANKLMYDYKLEMEKQAIEFEKTVTDRWKADNASDSYMSKNARPITLLSLLAFVYVIILSDSFPSFNFEVKDSYVDLLQMLLTTTVVAYFGSRGYEKVVSIKNK